ncbi:hypothetical protein [Herpetosiphon gulosus]
MSGLLSDESTPPRPVAPRILASKPACLAELLPVGSIIGLVGLILG